jgi:hypothetical protein
MFAAKLKVKQLDSIRVWVMLFNKKSEQRRLINFVNDDARTYERFFDKDTTCEPMSMKDARTFIGTDEPIWKHDGWSNSYDFVPFTAYEDVITYVGGIMPWHEYRHRRWNGVDHYDTYEKTTEFRKVG